MNWSFLKNFSFKTIAIVLLVAFIAPSVYLSIPTKKAEAAEAATSCVLKYGVSAAASLVLALVNKYTSIPTGDGGATTSNSLQAGSSISTFIQDCVVKPIIFAMIKAMLASLTQSLVSWINGDSGSGPSEPSFISDPGAFFLNIADNIAGQIILNSDLAFLCSPFKAQVQVALALNYAYSDSFSEQSQCTLSDVFANVDNAFSDFSAGGWDGWFAITQTSNNNPFGSFLNGAAKVDATINGKQAIQGAELQWNNGFLSYETCTPAGGGKPYTKFGGSVTGTVGGTTIGSSADKCTVSTPGKTIQGALDKTLGVSVDELGVADDLDKVVNALSNKILGSVFGGTGLVGTTKSTSGSGTSFLQQLADKSKTDAGTTQGDTNDTLNNVGNDSGDQTNDPQPPANIALGKKVTASSISQDGDTSFDPDKIVDGSTSSSGGGTSKFNGAITDVELGTQYLEIDLGTPALNINEIDVYERTNPEEGVDSPSNKYKMHYKVQVYSDSHKLIWESPIEAQNFNGLKEFKIAKPVGGLYVRLQGVDKGRFEIAEVKVFQNQTPLVSLTGAPAMTANLGSTFKEPGYVAKDYEDGDVTALVTVSGSVDTSTEGTYTLTYTVIDSQGAVGIATRKVTVTKGIDVVGQL